MLRDFIQDGWFLQNAASGAACCDGSESFLQRGYGDEAKCTPRSTKQIKSTSNDRPHRRVLCAGLQEVAPTDAGGAGHLQLLRIPSFRASRRIQGLGPRLGAFAML